MTIPPITESSDSLIEGRKCYELLTDKASCRVGVPQVTKMSECYDSGISSEKARPNKDKKGRQQILEDFKFKTENSPQNGHKSEKGKKKI